jgi:hypothetical protein
MGWPTNSATDEARVKWKIAMKFLVPVKFDVNRAINLYRTHEVSIISLQKFSFLFFFFKFLFSIVVKLKILIIFGLRTLILYVKFNQINFFHWYKSINSINMSISFFLF